MLKFEPEKILVNVLPLWKTSVNYDKLLYILLPKLSKWAENADSKDIFELESDSLKLIPVNLYNELYLHWKEKYGQHLVEVNYSSRNSQLRYKILKYCSF